MLKAVLLILSVVFCPFGKAIAQATNGQPQPAKINSNMITLDAQTHSGVFEGEVSAYETRDYILMAEKGQRLTLKLEQNRQQGLLLAEVIVFSVNGREPEQKGPRELQVLEESGEYFIRVLMPRSFARRHLKTHYKLHIKLEDKQRP